MNLAAKLSPDGSKLVVTWQPIADAKGFQFLVDDKAVSHTMDGSRTSVSFGIRTGTHSYGVDVLSSGDHGSVTWPAPVTPPAPPPPPASANPYTPNKTFTGGNFDAFLAGLAPGDVAAIAAGVTATLTSKVAWGGTSSSPIVVTSADWAKPATIKGRLDMRGTASWWLFDMLRFDDSATSFVPGHEQSWVIGGQNNIWRRCDLTNGNTKIGMEFINDSTYGVARNNTVDRCRIHDIGRLPTTKPDMTLYPAATIGLDGLWHLNNDHGIYDIGYSLHVVDTVIENCADRGYQCRGGKGALVEYTRINHCGEGVIFGDLGAVNSKLTKCVLLNNQVGLRRLIETYDPNHSNSGNIVDDCYAWNADGRAVQGGLSGLTVTSLHNQDPAGVAGYGPRVAVGAVA